MITSKHIGKIAAIIIVIAVILCLASILFSEGISNMLGGSGVNMQYVEKIFDTSSVIDINIIMDDDEWTEMLANAADEEYYKCDVEINGTIFNSVGIRPKGNTSLSNIVSDPDTDRYSFNLEFDHYIDGQTCFGLDKLILNNNYADATNMKEAIVYDMFEYLDADASLYNYSKLSVNGETWGVYLALEGVEDSFLLRNYGASIGKLYKPDSMNMGGPGGMKDMNEEDIAEMMEIFQNQNSDSISSAGISNDVGDFPKPPEMNTSEIVSNGFPEIPNDNADNTGNTEDTNNLGLLDATSSATTSAPNSLSTGGMNFHNRSVDKNNENGRGGFSSGGGADLNYIDDDLDSYSTIWDGEVNSSSKTDHQRVVTALKNISEQTDIESYMDIDNLLKYMAVHTFSVNLDSMSGTMNHNYYLYESSGKLNLIPWDYNLSWGGFSGGGMHGSAEGGISSGATSTVNFAIDTPFSGITDLSEKKFFAALLENDIYLAQYHEYLRQLSEEYVEGGIFTSTYERIRKQIDELVTTDPTAFYSYDEYDEAAQTLSEVIKLRAESIQGQLDGTIPATNSGQESDSSTLVDASNINLSVMGTMNMGGGNNGNRNMDAGNSERQNSENMDAGNSERQMESNLSRRPSTPENSSSNSAIDNSMPGGKMQMPNQTVENSQNTNSSSFIWYGVYLIIIVIACAAAVLYKRR